MAAAQVMDGNGTRRPYSSVSLYDMFCSESTVLSFAVSSFLSHSPRRRVILVACFLLGFVLTIIMKREHLLWLLTTAAGAKPILEFGQGSQFEFPGLRFGIDRQFKITVFGDLHFGEDNWKDCDECQEYDAKTVKAMNAILDEEPTTLAILNGDLLSSEAVDPSNYTDYIDHIVEPLVNRNIPWASAYGNHDRSFQVSPQALLEKEQSYNTDGKKLSWTDLSLPETDAQVGTTNYFIPIYSSSGGGNPDLVMLLWFFDSRDGQAFQQKDEAGNDVPISDFVAPEVVNWFNIQKAEIQKSYNRVIPSLAFVHIPFQAASGLRDLRKQDDSVAPGIDGEAIGHQANTCDEANSCKYDGNDSAFMKALVDTDGLMGVFSAHNHRIDWCMKWSNDNPLPDTDPATGNGLNVCFGRRTGYGGYSKTYAKGARKIVIHEDDLPKRELETWVRLEDGRISAPIMLNSTYGTDKYPPALDQDETQEQASSA